MSTGDLKAGLTSSRPKLSILPAAPAVYGTRGLEYGDDKYARGNYHGPPPAGVATTARVVGYLDAALRHLIAVTDAYNRAIGTGGDVAKALQVTDDKASGGFPASGLPHLAHALCSLSLAIQCGVDDGILPEDPGQPWKGGKVTEERSPEAAVRLAAVDRAECAAQALEANKPDLWNGYRRADVLAAAQLRFPEATHRFNNGALEYRLVGQPWTVEYWYHKEYRTHGLRRPDEPDYKPLA